MGDQDWVTTFGTLFWFLLLWAALVWVPRGYRRAFRRAARRPVAR